MLVVLPAAAGGVNLIRNPDSPTEAVLLGFWSPMDDMGLIKFGSGGFRLPALVGVVDLLGCMGVEVLVAAGGLSAAAPYQGTPYIPKPPISGSFAQSEIKESPAGTTSGVWCRASTQESHFC
jgi:hypothetical protein